MDLNEVLMDDETYDKFRSMVDRGLGFTWEPVDTPPPNSPGKWSNEVVTISNLGQVCLLCYFADNPPDGGIWQRPLIDSISNMF